MIVILHLVGVLMMTNALPRHLPYPRVCLEGIWLTIQLYKSFGLRGTDRGCFMDNAAYYRSWAEPGVLNPPVESVNARMVTDEKGRTICKYDCWDTGTYPHEVHNTVEIVKGYTLVCDKGMSCHVKAEPSKRKDNRDSPYVDKGFCLPDKSTPRKRKRVDIQPQASRCLETPVLQDPDAEVFAGLEALGGEFTLFTSTANSIPPMRKAPIQATETQKGLEALTDDYALLQATSDFMLAMREMPLPSLNAQGPIESRAEDNPVNRPVHKPTTNVMLFMQQLPLPPEVCLDKHTCTYTHGRPQAIAHICVINSADYPVTLSVATKPASQE